MEKVAVIMGKMHSGGKKNLVMEYYRNIDRKQIQFDFYCDEDSNAIPYDEIEQLGGKVFVVPKYQNILKNILTLKKNFKVQNYKIVHGYNGTMNIFGMYAAWRAGIPIRINESISMGHKSDKKNILKMILKPFSKFFSTHFMANGIECGKWQFGEKIYKANKIEIFRTVINTEKNRFNSEIREITRRKLNIKNDTILIGHIGRLTAQKNTLFLIDIFNEIVKLNFNSKLLIIGDGELKEVMLKRIKEYNLEENVIYLGRTEDIDQYYNAMDCFLLPSLYEGLPVVGIEAECHGLPIFFSTEIPIESSPCSDIGFFIDLNKTPLEWAEIIKEKVLEIKRKDHSEEVRMAGFDSKEESKKLLEYYKELLKCCF